MRLFVIIVAYNSAQTIGRCLESLAKALRGLDATVVVVDNASTDTTLERIKDQRVKIKNLILIENAKNVGFAAAVNSGVRAASDNRELITDNNKPQFIFLLNPDTEVEGDVVTQTVEWMSTHPNVGVAGPIMLNADGSFQPSVRRFPTFWTILGIALKLHRVFPRAKIFREYFAEEVNERMSVQGPTFSSSRSDLNRDDLALPVDQVMGAGFFVNEKCWRELGGMDERFFLWFEEVDFCKRARAAGWGVQYLPFRAIRHSGGASFGQRSRLKNQCQFFLSAAKYLLKHRSASPVWFDPRIFWIAAALTVFFELLSFWGHEAPVIGVVGLLVVSLLTVFFGLRDPVWPVAMVMAELAIGSKGYGLTLPLSAGAVSIRMALFAVAVAVGALWTIKTRGIALQRFFNRQRALAVSWFGLGFFILWAVRRGLYLGNPTSIIFFDLSPWLFTLLLPSFLVGMSSLKRLKIITSVLLGATAVFTLKTLFLLYVFTHDYALLLLPILYRWVRDTGNAEITQLGGNFWRIFAQSHLYTIIASAVWVSFGRRARAVAFWGSALGVATILMSLSRSFWFGIAAAVLLLLLLPATRAYLYRVTSRERVLRMFCIGLAGVVLLFFVARFPIPRQPTGLNLHVFTERVSNLSGEAAARSRWQLLPQLWHEIARAPMLGKGFGSTVRYRSLDPRAIASSQHGLFEAYRFEWGYLDVWLKMGFGGLLALLVLLAMISRRFFFLLRAGSENYQSLLFGLFWGLLIVSFTHITSPYLNHPLGIGYLLFVTSTLSVLCSVHMRKQAHLKIRGTVQAVNYRRWVGECAKRFSLAGWVRNAPDGAVEVCCQGECEDVEGFIHAARVGPERALVTGIDVLWQPLVDEKNNFEIEENGAHRAPTERG